MSSAGWKRGSTLRISANAAAAAADGAMKLGGGLVRYDSEGIGRKQRAIGPFRGIRQIPFGAAGQ